MLNILKKHAINFRGKSLSKKIVVFESDDWGSLRTPNLQAYNKFVQKGYVSPDDPFSKYDTLEREVDLQALFEVLHSVKDSQKRPALFTANTVMGNPDFEKIKHSNYAEYFYELFVDSYHANENSSNTLDVFKTGVKEKVFFPQFHGREHLNVPIWLSLLKKKNHNFLDAFQEKCFAIDYSNPLNRRTNLMASYDYTRQVDLEFIESSVSQGLAIFEEVFGYKSTTTIAPCYVWDSRIEEIFDKQGVKCFQGSKFQNVPNKNKFHRILHHNGECNGDGQLYLIRNCLFEPSIDKSVNWVDKCLESIQIAFQWKKPAIIGTHRLNYVGGLSDRNRDLGLNQLSQLLKKIILKWPDVEFVSSSELAAHYFNITRV